MQKAKTYILTPVLLLGAVYSAQQGDWWRALVLAVVGTAFLGLVAESEGWVKVHPKVLLAFLGLAMLILVFWVFGGVPPHRAGA